MKRKIKKILIANRSEIASRIIRTCKNMNIKTVAIYSIPDEKCMFVNEADEAYPLNGYAPVDTYLDIQKIISICKAANVDAVHPGYGFLSENYKFCEELEKNGIIFIGPSKESIKQMGDKINSKKLAIRAGVNTIPGYNDDIEDDKHLIKICKDIGYPVMIKASAGGGGKGMRVAWGEDEVVDNFHQAKNEARRNFKDDRVFVEKYIEKPRHIEIQVLGDKFENIVCLGERECSIQRFNQKIIEETPSPFITDEVRQEMFRQSKLLAEKCGYYSAGTVEYVVDKNKNFYFLEMNTRLQVEHAVTEFLVGIDIVEKMIEIVEGKALDLNQKDIKFKGHSIEARICAENPSLSFMPSSGVITNMISPAPSSDLRFDIGFKRGDYISSFYDAMIGKLIVHGKTRKDAIEKMKEALAILDIDGLPTNIEFLESIMRHKRFVSGDIDTNFIKTEYNNVFLTEKIDENERGIFILAALVIFLTEEKHRFSLSEQIDIFKKISYAKLAVMLDDVMYHITFNNVDFGKEVGVHYRDIRMTMKHNYRFGDKYISGVFNDSVNFNMKINKTNSGVILRSFGSSVKTRVLTFADADIVSKVDMGKELTNIKTNKFFSKINGMINEINVQEGDVLKKNQKLCVIESMKMQNTIFTEFDCVIKKIHKQEKDVIQVGDLLFEFED